MRNPLRLEILALVLVLVVGLVVRLQRISGSMPYVGHIDEKQITVPALHILQSGDFNPHTFEYPSLPTYLTAVGFTVGYFHACSRQKLRTTEAIGSIGYPYYSHSIVVYPARHLFAVLSLLTLFFAGILARELCASRWALCVAPAVVSLSTGYLYLSWKYINVDIAGAFFSTATLVYLFRRWNEHTAIRALGTGILCGLTIACKYSLYWILAPGLLAILLCEPRERLLHCAALLAGAAIAFLVVVPYALGDFHDFLNDVGQAIQHYASGHKGFGAEPGWPQLAYYFQQFRKEFGAAWFVFAAIGAFALLRADWHRGLVFLSFPVTHVAYMSMQRAHFNRHMAGVFVLLGVLITAGLFESSRWMAALLARTSWSKDRVRFVPPLAAATVALLLLVWVPWRNVAGAYTPGTDSRKIGRQWIEKNVPEGATLLIPEKLRMDARSLRGHYNVVEVSLRHLDDVIRNAGSSGYLLIPKFGYDSRGGAQAAEIADDVNKRFAAFGARPLEGFGTNDVLINYPEPVPGGDPAFVVAALSEAFPSSPSATTSRTSP